MQSQTASKQNTTADLMVAPIEWRVSDVKVIKHLSLLVTFNDGTQGQVLISPAWLTGIFGTLKQPSIFKAVMVEHGAVTWANGLDLDPKRMYDAIKLHGYYHIQ